ncbi:MAG: hypothetical protein O2834_06660 [Crenarchaeota archaeon]|nr:hypothetical protein [Thermoproteota archaeon]HJJ20838.1 hypothetical protein [Nitrosopumilus sp.]MDA0853642.1 hypothetical protein [Thermoproteota archaeon]MDA1123890.1 hypothetical protein [Thermoproteota archaeon]HJJ23945.1 hypothetical protein [Nitrosopumilus sp.]
MVKVKIRTGRGTGSIEVDVEDLKFSGDEFKKIQAERKKAAGNRMVSTGRGTGRVKISDIPEPKERPSTKGSTTSTGRGTGSRKSS